ncbi:cytochrome c biogenesis protein CcsA [uncultured Campylobacter sp.]|uniref:cytochrome c biogenesis protein CcsA n=1 Tax=uncultured Campylobacter sp. TaxID=218934 RepID=UPI00260BF013|nr:cytochrome c biogenesis protein CcsA [uncultured Campylobacter sp.]
MSALKILKFFISYKFALCLLFVLAAGAGVATFLESIYDTQTAKILVYEARWYECVMGAATLSLLGIIIKTKMWRRFGSFVLHAAFIVIFIGAALTRYFGTEGVLHVRAGESESEMVSVKPYLQIRTQDALFEHPLNLSQIGDNDFSFTQSINSKSFTVKFSSYKPAPKGEQGTLAVKAGFEGGSEQEAQLRGGAGWLGEPKILNFDGEEIMLSWGSKLVELPFAVKLLKFKLERYPGSQSPSSYASDVEILKEGKSAGEHEIYMNHPLSFDGFKLFQSSYDMDERGTVLELNRDPGKIPTYFGYFLLCVGFIGNLFTAGSRFKKLAKFIKNNAPAALLLIAPLFFNIELRAADENYLANLKANSRVHANGAFAELLVQDYMGRIKPLSTEASEIVNKISGTEGLYGLSAEQMILGMSLNPAFWRDQKIIKIKNDEIKKMLGLAPQERYASFNSVFDENGNYKLAHALDEANEKSASRRGVLDNELIKFDERLNIAYLTFRGVFFKFIPVPNDPQNTWLSPNDAFADYSIAPQIKGVLNDYLNGLQDGISDNDWAKADAALAELKNYQRATSAAILPSENRVKAEVFYNKASVFKKLVYCYMILGGVALILALLGALCGKSFMLAQKILFGAFAASFAAHTLALTLRWYVAAHAPWSDSYESMIYIGWSAALAGIIFFRKSLLTLSASCLLASIVMLVAHMSFVNPQITNLVPVLKSYWLSIHVSVITASYGFLGLSCLLGLLALVLMALKNSANCERLNAQIRYITAINEISLIVGLSMLTLGNFFGGVWANESWGRYWGWDSKETWSYVSIIVYAIVLHLKLIPKLGSIYVYCVSSTLAYSSIIMTYFGVNFYLTGMHSYAAGDAPQIPAPFYCIIAAVFLIIALAFRGRDVKTI